jgi:two-component system chemotaxis response regulator CheB
MSSIYLNSLAKRINTLCDTNVKIANKNEKLNSGTSYLSNGDLHLKIKKDQGSYIVYYTDGAPVNRHKPSIDVLFESASIVAKNNAVGVLLTGMGKDGAQALKKMRNSGSYTIVQDKYTSIIYGMPKAALDIDAADEELPLERIANRLLELSE